MKKKFFVLRQESPSGSCRLEYYDSEKKFRAGGSPKRAVNIKTCFNINKKMDTKQKFAIALYTKDDCFAIVCDNEKDQDDWLTSMLELQQGDKLLNGDEKPRPTFEHVWQVTIKNKGLGNSKDMQGEHRLCLTTDSVNLIKKNAPPEEMLALQLLSIRKCGHSDCFFFMELGRSSSTGAGELWMQTEDTIIAQNMHEAILGAMRALHQDENLSTSTQKESSRGRSTSVGEHTKPISAHVRRSQAATGSSAEAFPIQRNRTMSEGDRNIAVTGVGSPLSNRYKLSSPIQGQGQLRPHTMIGRGAINSPQSYSPPVISPLSPSESGGSSVSIDEGDGSQSPSDFYLSVKLHGMVGGHSSPHHSPLPTTVEVPEDYLSMSPTSKSSSEQETGYMEMSPSSSKPPRPDTNRHHEHRALMSPGSETGSPYLEMTHSQSSDSGTFSLKSKDRTSNSKVAEDSSYLAMNPSASKLEKDVIDVGYVDMAPMSRHQKTKLPSSESGHLDAGYLDMEPGYKPPGHSEPSGYLEMAPGVKSKDMLSYFDMSHSLSLPPVEESVQDTPGYLSMKPGSGSSSASYMPHHAKEFHLEKVHSYLAPSDDGVQRSRCYSLGDKTAALRKQIQADVLKEEEVRKGRAYSIGSKPQPSTANSVKKFLEISLSEDRKCASAPHINEDEVDASAASSTDELVKKPILHSYKGEDLVELDFEKSSQESLDQAVSDTSQDLDSGTPGRSPKWGSPDTSRRHNVGMRLRKGSYSESEPARSRQNSLTERSIRSRQNSIGEVFANRSRRNSLDKYPRGSASRVVSDKKGKVSALSEASLQPESSEQGAAGEYINIDYNKEKNSSKKLIQLQHTDRHDYINISPINQANSISKKPTESYKGDGSSPTNIEMGGKKNRASSAGKDAANSAPKQSVRASSEPKTTKEDDTYTTLSCKPVTIVTTPSEQAASCNKTSTLIAPMSKLASQSSQKNVSLSKSLGKKSSEVIRTSEKEMSPDYAEMKTLSLRSIGDPFNLGTSPVMDIPEEASESGVVVKSSDATSTEQLPPPVHRQTSEPAKISPSQNPVSLDSSPVGLKLNRACSAPTGVAVSPRQLNRLSHEYASPYENLNLTVNRTSPRSSVSSEKDLNYATLDLVPTDESPRRNTSSSDLRRSRNSSATSGSDSGPETLQYTEIDFTKSEGLRQVASACTMRENRFH